MNNFYSENKWHIFHSYTKVLQTVRRKYQSAPWSTFLLVVYTNIGIYYLEYEASEMPLDRWASLHVNDKEIIIKEKDILFWKFFKSREYSDDEYLPYHIPPGVILLNKLISNQGVKL
jgi:hypothetical protein